MTSVAVPPELRAMLAGPLARRGLRVAGPQDRAIATVGSDPPDTGRWLALVADRAAATAALDAGADDAASAADGPELIAARVARLLRPAMLRVGSLTIDPVARIAARNGRRLQLLPREYAVLLHLACHAEMLVSRPELRSAVWGRDFNSGTNVIEVHVSRLRAQLDRDAPAMLLTERGRGYRLVSRPAIAERRQAS